LHYAVRHNPVVFLRRRSQFGHAHRVSLKSGRSANWRPISRTITLLNTISSRLTRATTCTTPGAPTSNPVKQGDNWLAANLPTIPWLGRLSKQWIDHHHLRRRRERPRRPDRFASCFHLWPKAMVIILRSVITPQREHCETLQKIFAVGPFFSATPVFGN